MLVRRILISAVAALAVGAAGCGSNTKATVPAVMGPALGNDTPGESGGRKSQPKEDAKGKTQAESER